MPVINLKPKPRINCCSAIVQKRLSGKTSAYRLYYVPSTQTPSRQRLHLTRADDYTTSSAPQMGAAYLGNHGYFLVKVMTLLHVVMLWCTLPAQ